MLFLCTHHPWLSHITCTFRYVMGWFILSFFAATYVYSSATSNTNNSTTSTAASTPTATSHAAPPIALIASPVTPPTTAAPIATSNPSSSSATQAGIMPLPTPPVTLGSIQPIASSSPLSTSAVPPPVLYASMSSEGQGIQSIMRLPNNWDSLYSNKFPPVPPLHTLNQNQARSQTPSMTASNHTFSKLPLTGNTKIYGPTLMASILLFTNGAFSPYPLTNTNNPNMQSGNQFLNQAFSAITQIPNLKESDNPIVSVFTALAPMANLDQNQRITCYYRNGLLYTTYDAKNPSHINPSQNYNEILALNDLFSSNAAPGTYFVQTTSTRGQRLINPNKGNDEFSVFLGRILATGTTLVPKDTICVAQYLIATQ